MGPAITVSSSAVGVAAASGGERVVEVALRWKRRAAGPSRQIHTSVPAGCDAGGGRTAGGARGGGVVGEPGEGLRRDAGFDRWGGGARDWVVCLGRLEEVRPVKGGAGDRGQCAARGS